MKAAEPPRGFHLDNASESVKVAAGKNGKSRRKRDKEINRGRGAAGIKMRTFTNTCVDMIRASKHTLV